MLVKSVPSSVATRSRFTWAAAGVQRDDRAKFRKVGF